jgi:hypothetical protein
VNAFFDAFVFADDEELCATDGFNSFEFFIFFAIYFIVEDFNIKYNYLVI